MLAWTPMIGRITCGIASVAIVLVIAPVGTARAQELETETARLLPQGAVKAGAGLEYQRGDQNTEQALPVLIEGGLTDRLELVIEPVAFTRIHPNGNAATAIGTGDTELTLLGLAYRERGNVPSIALGGEIKIPTARNKDIGTRKVDYAGYLVLSKRFGPVDLHANASFTFVGTPDAPMNMNVSNIIGYAVAAKFFFGDHDRGEIFGEVFGNTAASSAGESSTQPELTSGELVGAIGAGYYVTPWLLLHLGASVDNTGAVQIHPGFLVRQYGLW